MTVISTIRHKHFLLIWKSKFCKMLILGRPSASRDLRLQLQHEFICCTQNFTHLSQKWKLCFTYQRLVLQPVFYTFVTKMEAWLYLLEVSVAASFLHLCHKNGSLALPTIGECCSQFFHLCHKNGSLALPTKGQCCSQFFTSLSHKWKLGFTYQR